MANGTFSPLVAGGNPNPEAWFEHVAGLVAVYSGQQSLAQSILAQCGGGTLVVFLYNPTGTLPSLALIQQGSTWVVWIAGTVNTQQWIGNVTGAIDYVSLTTTVIVHGYFWSLAQQLWAAAKQYLPPPASSPVFVLVGHSLGGAVAQILAYLASEQYGWGAISVLTFGQPKAFGGDAGPANQASVYHRVRINGDIVPRLPLTQGETWYVGGLSGLWAGSALRSWNHYGNGYILGTDGSIVGDAGDGYWAYVPFSWLPSATPSVHLIKYHVAALETNLGV